MPSPLSLEGNFKQWKYNSTGLARLRSASASREQIPLEISEVNVVEKSWASIRLTLVLLYLGVLPLTPDLPLPIAFALLALAMAAAVPLLLRLARTLSCRVFVSDQRSVELDLARGSWPLHRPMAPGTRGTVRSRAPSTLNAAHG